MLDSVVVRAGARIWLVGLAALTAALVLVGLAAAPGARPARVVAADPSPAPVATATPVRAPTCAERYPADGPAGVDLRLGCMVNELVHAYTGLGSGPTGEPGRISAWLPILGGGLAGIVGLWLVTREVRRRAGRRLAPVVATTWWSCPACRSLNAAGIAACYRCGRAWEPGLTELRRDAEEES